MASDRRSFLNLTAFALPSVPLSAFGLPLVVYLPEYYSNDLALPLAGVGSAFMLVRILDMMFDPVFGAFMDRVSLPWGRFKPWMVIGAPLVMLGAIMLFFAQKGVDLIYLWFWLIVVYIGYSVSVLSHTSWAATLSRDYDQRSRVYGFWQTGNVLGIIVILALPVLLAILPKMDGVPEGVPAMGLFIAIMLPIAVGLAVWRVDEPSGPMRTTGQVHARLSDYFALFRRETVRRLLTADILLHLAAGITGALFFFYFQRVKSFTKTESEILLLAYFLTAICGGPVWGWLSGRLGKAKTMIVAALVYAVVQVGIVLLPSGDVGLALPFLILGGLPFSAAGMLLRSMMADVSDEERLMTGIDRTGLLYAILTGTIKLANALAVGITFVGLDIMGFKADAANASSVAGMTGLQLLYAILPASLGVLAVFTMIGYPLSAERHAEIRRQLVDRDQRERDTDVQPFPARDSSQVAPTNA